MKDDSLKNIIRDLKNYIELEKESGMDEFMLSSVMKNQDLVVPQQADEISQFSIKPLTLNEKKSALDKLKEAVSECTQCGLCRLRRNIVFGEGAVEAKLMFIGEAPGMQEDIQGKAFVGKAGELLTKIIEAIGFKRADVYIANCLKCRPPQNRNPLPSEIIACREFFLKQIEIIGPKVICCLGKFAAQTVLMSEEPISKLRGKFHELGGIKVMPTFHPAYLLRNPQDKRLVWEDMKKVRDLLKDTRT
jgi:uracil-DNA glycosylase